MRTRLVVRAAVLVAAAVATAGRAESVAPMDTMPRTGLVLYVGNDAALPAELAATGRYIVNQLADADRAGALRQGTRTANVSGRVVVEAMNAAALRALPDQFIDVLLDERGAIGAEDVTRIMNVGGRVLTKKGGTWQLGKYTPAAGLDDWSHKWHSPTGNVLSRDEKAGPPVTVQWVAGPALADGAMSGKHPVIADGLHAVVDNVDGAVPVRSAGSGLARARISANLTPTAEIVLSDGQIFCRPQPASVSRRSLREAGELLAFNAHTGEVATKFADAPTGAPTNLKDAPSFPVTLVMADHIVSCARHELAALDRKTGKALWKKSLEDGQWYSPIVAENLVVVCELPLDKPARRGRIDLAGSVRRIVAFDLTTGAEKWSFDDPLKHKGRELPNPAAALMPISYGEGNILLQSSFYQCRAPDAMIAVLDAQTGKERWRYAMPEGVDVKNKWSATDSASRIIIRDGKLIYVGGHSQGTVVIFDADSGRILGEPKRPKGRIAFNGECSGSLASTKWLVMSSVVWWDKEINATIIPAARSACGTGTFPAQGMAFVNPTGCDCTSYTRGYLGLNTTPLKNAVDDAKRLTRGAAAPAAREMKGWTSFLGSPQRLGYIAAALPEQLAVKHTVALAPVIAGPLLDDMMRDEYWGGAVTGATMAEGKAFVGLPDAHAIAAVDLATGKVAWQTVIGGPMDGPPTLYAGLAIVGSQDGSIYALNASTGEIVWRFNAAPHERRAMLQGRLASAFPVPASVLVLNDTVLATAGYHTYLGGIHSWALDPRTGTEKGRAQLVGDASPTQTKVVLNDMLVATHDNKNATIFRNTMIGLDGKFVDAGPIRGPLNVGGTQRAAAFDRRVAMVRFPHGTNRGGSTHGWGNLMQVAGISGYRVVTDGNRIYRLNEVPTPRVVPDRTIALEAYAMDATRQSDPLWKMSNKDLDIREAYTSMLKAGDRIYLGGGTRDGKTGFVQVISAEGKLLQTIELPAQVSASGLAAADGTLVASCVDGSIVVLSK